MIVVFMAHLPKSIIKKYGISKKAWAVFRGTKRSTPHTPRRKGRHSHSGFMAKHKTYHKKSIGNKINELAIVATAFIEPYIDSLVNSFSAVAGGLASILKLVAAYFLKKKGGMIGNIAKTIYIIEIYKLARTLVSGGGLSGLLGSVGKGATGGGYVE